MDKTLFQSAQPAVRADVVKNHAGGNAFALDAKAQLAQYVMTGTFKNTFYAKAEDDLSRVISLAEGADPLFLAKLAIHGRTAGYMKDAPALLLAMLSVKDPVLFAKAFGRVIDNGKMLRNFVQVVRSGVAGRKSLGNGPKTQVARWLQNATVHQLLGASVGNDPSLADVINLSRPKGRDAAQAALFGHMLGKKVDLALLPQEVLALDAFRKDPSGKPVPNVDFRLVDSFLTAGQWKDVARHAPWQMTRMNLNTFHRHGVFADAELVRIVADRLADPTLIAKANVFPYQLMAAYRHAQDDVPRRVLDALHAATDLALQNVPAFKGRVAVCPDVSGSMHDPITGKGTSKPSKMRCIDVAALVTAAVLAKNPDAIVLPFDTGVIDAKRLRLTARDSILTNAEKLSAIQGGGTSVSKPLERLLQTGEKVDAVFYVSDYESWADRDHAFRAGTTTQSLWDRYRRQVSPDAKLVALDVTPNTSVQARSDQDTLNIGGFSDAVFGVVNGFLSGDARSAMLVQTIDQVEI